MISNTIQWASSYFNWDNPLLLIPDDAIQYTSDMCDINSSKSKKVLTTLEACQIEVFPKDPGPSNRKTSKRLLDVTVQSGSEAVPTPPKYKAGEGQAAQPLHLNHSCNTLHAPHSVSSTIVTTMEVVIIVEKSYLKSGIRILGRAPNVTSPIIACVLTLSLVNPY